MSSGCCVTVAGRDERTHAASFHFRLRRPHVEGREWPFPDWPFPSALSECVPLSISLSYGRVMVREPIRCQNVCRCQPVIWACYGTGTHSLSQCVPLSYGRICGRIMVQEPTSAHTETHVFQEMTKYNGLM